MPEQTKTKPVAKPAIKPAGLVGVVCGNHAVNGVAPGGEVVAGTVEFARHLHNAGHARFLHPDGSEMTDGDLVALIEAGHR